MRARAALAKGLVMAAFGFGVLVKAGFRIRSGVPPLAPAMIPVGTLALLASTLRFSPLWRHREDDIYLRWTWLCSRNARALARRRKEAIPSRGVDPAFSTMKRSARASGMLALVRSSEAGSGAPGR